MTLLRRLWAARNPVAAPPPLQRPEMRISAAAAAVNSGRRTGLNPFAGELATGGKPTNPWQFPEHAPGVLPRGHKTMATLAQDSEFAFGGGQNVQVVASSFGYANAFHGLWAEGIGFMGYPYLAELTQRPEYRRPSEILAEEMTRKWLKLKATGDEDKSEKISVLNNALRRYNVRQIVRDALELDGYFGRAQIHVNVGTDDDDQELLTPLLLRPEKVARGSLKGFRVVDPTWTATNDYNAIDPLRPDFYKPQTWFVMGRLIHASRLLTIVSRPVPDLLKPAYNFGGLALSQMLKPYVDNWLRTRQSVSDLIQSFTVFVLETNMQAFLQGGDSPTMAMRAEFFTNVRRNLGLMMTDKDTEAFQNVSAPLGGLDHLQAQAQEHMASVSGVPLVKLTGITPSGLNACLTADTLIETDRGQVPIIDVRPTDRVMTRSGFAPIAWAKRTGYTNELIEIRTSESCLRCTANHPIWSPSINAFVPAGNVRPGDLLLCRGATERSQGMAILWRGAADSGGLEATAITPQARPYFTERFGRLTTALYQGARTSITLTGTVRTIRSAISKYFRLPITQSITAWLTVFSFISTQNLTVSAAIAASHSSSLNLHEPFSVATGADWLTGGWLGSLKSSRNWLACVSSVADLLRHLGGVKNSAHGSALPQVKIAANIVAHTTCRTQNAIGVPTNQGSVVDLNEGPTSGCEAVLFAAKNSQGRSRNAIATSTAEQQPIESVRLVQCEQEPIYDIQVAAGYLPEFFANSICVHNSSDGEIRVFYDTIHARQERLLTPILTTILEVIQLSEFGVIDPEIVHEWVPLYQLDEAGRASVRKIDADTDAVLIESGIVTPEEARTRLAADSEGLYAGLEGDAPGLPDAAGEIPGMNADPAERIATQGANGSGSGANAGE